MANGKVEPVEDKVGDGAVSSQIPNSQSIPSSTPGAQQTPSTSAQDPSARTSVVRNFVLDKVVAQHEQRIAELERKVEKRKETYRRLSSPSPFIPPHGLDVAGPQVPPSGLPSGSAAPPSPALQTPTSQAKLLSTAGNPNNAKQHPSQSLAHNPAIAATIAAFTAASTPTAALHPQYPFFPYPHPDSPVMAPPFMGVVPAVPTHPTHQPVQSSAPTQPAQPNTASEDGGPTQSRYWTPDEHQRFLAAGSRYGSKNYQQIAEVVGTRNAKQVRTHSQKYQKKLEREEARRRGDGRSPMDVHSQTHKAVVLTAEAGESSKANHTQLRQGEVHRGGPATASSKNASPNEAPHSTKSAEGSSSTNNASLEKNTDGGIDIIHENAKAAAAAVLAEAVALGGGCLPPGALKMMNGSHPAKSTSQNQATGPIRPAAARVNGGHVAVTSNGAALTDPANTVEKQSKPISGTINRKPSQTNVSASRHDEQAVVIAPAASGADRHQVVDPPIIRKTHKTAGTISPALQSSHSSQHGAIVCSKVGSDKIPEAKPTRSAVKIEPRIAAFESSNNSRPLPSSTAAVATPQHSATPKTTPSKPIIKVVSTKNGAKITRQEAQEAKHVAASRLVETREGRDLLLVEKTGTVALALHKKTEVPNGRHSGTSLSLKAPRAQTEQGVDGKIDKQSLDTPATSKQVTGSASISTPEQNLAEGFPVAPSKSGNGNVRDNSEQEQIHVKSPDNVGLGAAMNGSATSQENANCTSQPSLSKGEAAGRPPLEEKPECAYTGDMETSKNQVTDDAPPNGSSDTKMRKKGTEELSDESPKKKAPSKQDDECDQANDSTDLAVEADKRATKIDVHVDKQCSTPTSAGGASLSPEEVNEASPKKNGDPSRDVKRVSCVQGVDTETDQTVAAGSEGAHDGASGEGGAEDKRTGQGATKPDSDETGDMGGAELEKGGMKRSVEDASESATKRQRGKDGGMRKSRAVVEKCDIGREVKG